jgi:hypothetical protein
MPSSDLNLDAYRILSDNLSRVRHAVRTVLCEIHGPDWEEEVEPEDRRVFLNQRREREINVNWRRSDHSDILDYGNFSDLCEFVSANPVLLKRFSVLARDPELLRLRFLELDTLFNRVAFARPISESELELLISFDDRLKRLDTEPPARGAAKEAPPEARPAAQPEASAVRPSPAKTEAPAGPAPMEPAEPATEKESATVAAAEEANEAPTHTSPRKVETPRRRNSEQKPLPSVSMARLREALSEGEEQTILTAVYAEVTALADGLWSDSSPPNPRVWEALRESDWYSQHFVDLGLRPVSDFYDLAGTARERMLEGTSRRELQEFLKERRFAQVLLSLRDLFRQRLKLPNEQ